MKKTITQQKKLNQREKIVKIHIAEESNTLEINQETQFNCESLITSN